MTTARDRCDRWQARGHMWASAGQCYFQNDPENPVDQALIDDASDHHAEMYALLSREPMVSVFAGGATRLHVTVIVGSHRHQWLCGLGAPQGDAVWEAAPPYAPRDPQSWLCKGCIAQSS